MPVLQPNLSRRHADPRSVALPPAACLPCRLAAQQLGLFTLVAELQEGWAQAEAAWRSMPQHATSSGQGAQEEQRPAADTEGAAEAPEEDLQPPFREAVFAAAHAWAAAAGGEAAEQSDAVAPGEAALPLLRAVAAAPAALEALSLDEFPRMLAWSEGLCGLTLLPLRWVWVAVVPDASRDGGARDEGRRRLA